MEEKKAKISQTAREVLERRYLVKDDKGKVTESPEQMLRRVADAVATGEDHFTKGPGKKEVADKYYDMLVNLDFLPNSPTLMNAGRKLGQLSACFVLPVPDSMEGIFDAIRNTAIIHKSGGGTGFSFSRLRPSGATVSQTQGTASGPISFMSAFDAATETVKQGGKRRGANMGMLRVDHPDILSFIVAKKDNDKLNNFNISVAVTDKFMKALAADKDYDLIDPHTNKKAGQLNAREVFDLIVDMAWHNGEPGIIFIDRVNKDNPTPQLGEMESTNPCGEQPLLPYESCNLGSINLAHFVKGGRVDWDALRETTRLATRFLDDVVEVNKFPLPEIAEVTQANRKIGLGVMGFADMLILLGIPYNSEEAVVLAEKTMKFILDEGRAMSMELAKERGVFANWKGSVWEARGIKIRNAAITTIAPTGTISMIADASSGVEPLFAVSFVKNVMDKDELVMTNPYFLDMAKERGFYTEELMKKIAKTGTLEGFNEVPEDMKRSFVVAHDVTPVWHIKIQAAFQKYTDNAVSKTVNFPHSATERDVAEVYKLAYDLGCKGVTIYRDGSRDEQVLNIGKVNKKSDGTEVAAPVEIPGILRERPHTIKGRTIMMNTGCGKLYVTINEDENGKPFEVFSMMGKAGGCASSQAEGLSRMLSIALRSGIEPQVMIKHLKNISCHRPAGFGPNRVTSCADAIAKAMEEFIKPKLDILDDLKPAVLTPAMALPMEVPVMMEAPQSAQTEVLAAERHAGGVCRECGGPIEYEGGCLVCHSCGYSECG